MIQKQYSLDPLSQYLKDHPNAKNPELYSICSAETNSQKTGVRRKKGILLKRKSNDTESPGEITSLTPDSVEKLIKDKLNNKSNIPDTQIRMALDYLIKLKITDESGMEQLDMEAFLEHELSERQEKSNPSVH